MYRVRRATTTVADRAKTLTRPSASGVTAATQTRYWGEKTFPKTTKPTTAAADANSRSRGPRDVRAKRNQTPISAAASASEPTTATTFAAGPARSHDPAKLR